MDRKRFESGAFLYIPPSKFPLNTKPKWTATVTLSYFSGVVRTETFDSFSERKCRFQISPDSRWRGLERNPSARTRFLICVFHGKFWHCSTKICVVSEIGCCPVLNFRVQITTNQTDCKDKCSATSSLWHSRPESLRIQISPRHARRVYVVFFIGKGTFVSIVLTRMEWNKLLSLQRRRIIGARMHIIIQDGDIENLLCQAFCSKITPALQATSTLLFWIFFFLLTLQVATSAYEIKLRDSVWSRTHIKDQVNVRPRMELVLFLEHFFASQVSWTLFALADPYMRILNTGASLGFCCKLPSSLAESQFCRWR